ncbi:MAG: TIGR01459 family HAD-type hydrolase [Paracoccaceae bacterium]|nr:TIGR01459 family HAD-type hydrolase [Paracoccaceae bacterium]
MTLIIKSLAEITGNYDVLFCDLWGCLHNGVEPFAEAVDALRAFRAKGGIVILLTNAPRPRAAVRRQLERIGVPEDCWDDIVTSGDASQAGMAAGLAGNKVYHIGPDKDYSFFTDFPRDIDASHIERVPLENAEGIVCTGLFDDLTETPEDYRATLLFAKQKGMKLICTNPDLVVDYGEQRLYCAGALAALFTDMGGESLYFGKPHPPIYDLARNRMAGIKGVDPSRILCVGDGIHTDVQGGLAEGLDTLFITGGLAADQFGQDPVNPDEELLNRWLIVQKMSPTAAISKLR